MTGPADKNLTWDASRVPRERREGRLGQKGCVLWLTGLSGSGKSTLARELEVLLVERGAVAYVLDGDNVRHGLSADLGFSPAERTENIRRVGEVAALLADAGLVVVTAFIAPYRADRGRAGAAVERLLGPGRFFEVHLDADARACEARDPKGLYAKARRGEIADFTGVDAPYEVPEAPALRLDTTAAPVGESALAMVHLLERAGMLEGDPS